MDSKGMLFKCFIVFITLTINPVFAEVTEPSVEVSDTDLPNIKKLRDKLFKEDKYDRNIRPITHHSNTTVVEISMVPKYVIDLIEDRTLFVLDSLLFLSWNDFRLSWNPDDYEGLEKLHVASHMIWQPDIKVYNSHSWNMDPKMHTHVLIMSNGDVWFPPPAMTTTYCPMDKADSSYPYDTIVCDVQLGSWSHDGWQVDLRVLQEKMYMDLFSNHNQRWKLLVDQVNITRVINHYNCCEEPYIMVIAKFPLARRYPAELKVIWSPCVLVMALTLTMFWIRPDSWKKLVFGPILILILTVLIVYVGSVTKSQTSLLKAASFLLSTMYAVVSAIILEVLVINISNICGPLRPPELLVNVLSTPLVKHIAIYTNWSDKVEGDKIQLKEDSEQVVNHPSAKDEWMLFGAVTDRFLFVVFVIVFASIHSL